MERQCRRRSREDYRSWNRHLAYRSAARASVLPLSQAVFNMAKNFALNINQDLRDIMGFVKVRRKGG
jgi:hypothetical protein